MFEEVGEEARICCRFAHRGAQLNRSAERRSKNLLQPRALCEDVADQIRERIRSHDLKAGQEVDEADLLNAYGVSRTPVREALKLLQHEGLLTGRPRRGMTVTVLTAEELREAGELYDLLRSHVGGTRGEAYPSTSRSLQTRMLEMAERHLRLAYGPSFEDRMER